jgi:hypothetical protein
MAPSAQPSSAPTSAEEVTGQFTNSQTIIGLNASAFLNDENAEDAFETTVADTLGQGSDSVSITNVTDFTNDRRKMLDADFSDGILIEYDVTFVVTSINKLVTTYNDLVSTLADAVDDGSFAATLSSLAKSTSASSLIPEDENGTIVTTLVSSTNVTIGAYRTIRPTSHPTPAPEMFFTFFNIIYVSAGGFVCLICVGAVLFNKYKSEAKKKHMDTLRSQLSITAVDPNYGDIYPSDKEVSVRNSDVSNDDMPSSRPSRDEVNYSRKMYERQNAPMPTLVEEDLAEETDVEVWATIDVFAEQQNLSALDYNSSFNVDRPPELIRMSEDDGMDELGVYITVDPKSEGSS